MKYDKNIPQIIKDWLFWIGVFLFAICFFSILFLSCNPLEKFYDSMNINDDNIVEELTEYGIKKETGIDLDLTSRSKE